MSYKKTAIVFVGLGRPSVTATEELYRLQNIPVVYNQTKNIVGLIQYYLMSNSLFRHVRLPKRKEGNRNYNRLLDKIGIPKTELTLQHAVLASMYRLQLNTFITNHAAYAELNHRAKGLKFDYTTGYSFGIYNAIVASGALDFEDALMMVKEAAKIITNASKKLNGGLAIIRWKGPYDLEPELERIGDKKVKIAIDNSPNMKVLAGPIKDLDRIISYFKNDKDFRKAEGAAKLLNGVNIPFHSDYMKDVADLIWWYIVKEDRRSEKGSFIGKAKHELIAPTSTKSILDPLDILAESIESIRCRIRWSDTIKRATDELGITRYIVIGIDEGDSVAKSIGILYP